MSILKLIWQGRPMKKLNLHDMYTFGKQLEPISRLDYDTKVVSVAVHLWFARERLKRLTEDDSPLLSTSRRAARKLINAIDDVLPQEFTEVMDIDKEKTLSWKSTTIKNATEELESVLGNDMPDIAAYIVSQKGIYRTDDLI